MFTEGILLRWKRRVKQRRFVRNVGILSLANSFNALLSFIQGIWIARLLGPELYGVAALIMAYPALIEAFLSARSSETLIKYLSQFDARQQTARALAICKVGYALDFLIAIIAFLITLLTAHWVAENVVHEPESVWLILLYSAACVPRSLAGTSHSVLVTLNRFTLSAGVETLGTLVRVTLVIGLVLCGLNVAGVIIGSAVGLALTGFGLALAALPAVKGRWGRHWWHGKWAVLGELRREILSFLGFSNLAVLLSTIPKQFDVILLGFFRGPAETAYYHVAKRFATVLVYLVDPLQTVTYPDLARRVADSGGKAADKRVSRLAWRLGLPAGIGALALIPLIPYVLPILVGPAYLPAALAAQLLFGVSAVWLGCFWMRPLYMARGWIKEWTMEVAVFSAANLIGWILWVPAYGYVALSAWRLVCVVVLHARRLVVFLRGQGKDG